MIPAAAAHFFQTIDELQRKIQLEGLAFGFVAAAVLTLTYGCLGNAGLPQPNWVWVWPFVGPCWRSVWHWHAGDTDEKQTLLVLVRVVARQL